MGDSDKKNKYLVAQVRKLDNSPKTYIEVGSNFATTRDALKWVKAEGGDEVPYTILKVIKNVEVETVSTKRVLDRP